MNPLHKYEYHGIKVPYEELFTNERYPRESKLLFDSIVNDIRIAKKKGTYTKEDICKMVRVRPVVYDWYCLYLDDVKSRS